MRAQWFRTLTGLPDLTSVMIADNANGLTNINNESNTRMANSNNSGKGGNKRIDPGKIRKSIAFHSLKNKK